MVNSMESSNAKAINRGGWLFSLPFFNKFHYFPFNFPTFPGAPNHHYFCVENSVRPQLLSKSIPKPTIIAAIQWQKIQ
jgi:hypothetical protein